MSASLRIRGIVDGGFAVTVFVAVTMIFVATIPLAPLLRAYRRARPLDPERPRRLLIVGYTALDDARAKGVISSHLDTWFNPAGYFDVVQVIIVAGRRRTEERLSDAISYREHGPNGLAAALGLRATARILGLVPATLDVVVSALRADVAQVNGPNMAAAPALVTRCLTGIPSAVFIEAFWEDILPHQNLPGLVKRLLPWWYMIVYRAFDTYFGGPSMYPERYVRCGMDRERIHSFLNNVDVERMIGTAAQGRVLSAVQVAPRPLFVTVGRLHDEKLSADALAAFAVHAANGGAGSFVFIGDGPLRGALAESAAHSGIAERVIFTGALPLADAAATVAFCDVFLATYQGNALVEAMALGTAVVAYDNPPHRALAPGSGHVIFVPDRDVLGLGRALSDAVSDPLLLRARGEAAQRFVQKLYTRANVDAIAVEPHVAAWHGSKRAA
jgi:glycosyltransferase involved in cell wall biosynthesis